MNRHELVHELATPLTALRLALDRGRLEQAQQSADRLQAILERARAPGKGNVPPIGRKEGPMRRKGLSLLEVLVSLALFGSVALGIVTVYTGLLAGTRKAGTNSQAVAVLDTLADLWEVRLKEQWPSTPPPDPPASLTGTFQNYAYQVDDLGRIPLPGSPGEFLEARKVKVTLFYQEQGTPRQVQLTTLVAR